MGSEMCIRDRDQEAQGSIRGQDQDARRIEANATRSSEVEKKVATVASGLLSSTIICDFSRRSDWAIVAFRSAKEALPSIDFHKTFVSESTDVF